MARGVSAAVSQPLAVARKLFGSPCKLITTFKSSNISRRRARFASWRGCRAGGGCRTVATSGQGMTAEGVRKRASGPFARGNFRSYKKSYRSSPRRVRPGSSISRIPGDSPFLPCPPSYTQPSLAILLLSSPAFLSFLNPSFSLPFSPAASPRALVAPSPSFSLSPSRGHETG